MAKRTPLTPEVRQQVFTLYEELMSVRETGRRLNLHENTVRLVLKATKGICADCPTPIKLGQRYCEACTQRRNAWMKTRRKERRRQGLCIECDLVVEPPSPIFCAQHRLQNIDRHAKSREAVNTKRLAPGAGVPEQQQREKQLRYEYGPAGIEAWNRDKGQCTMCGASYLDKTIHVHHRDCDKTHNTPENLVCLCYRCHKVVHHFLDYPSQVVLDWLRAYYPELSLV